MCVFFLVLFSHFPKRMFYTFSLGLGIMGCIYFLTSRCIMGKDSRAVGHSDAGMLLSRWFFF